MTYLLIVPSVFSPQLIISPDAFSLQCSELYILLLFSPLMKSQNLKNASLNAKHFCISNFSNLMNCKTLSPGKQ